MKILGDEGVRTLIQIVKERTGEAVNEERFAELVNQALSAYDFSGLEYNDADIKSRLQALENKPGFDPSDLIDRILALETADNAYDDAEVKARIKALEDVDTATKKDVGDAIAELRGGSDETVQSLTKLKEVLTEGNVGQITEALEGYSPKEHSHDDLASKDHNHDTEYSQKDHTHSGYLTTESLGDYAKKSQAVSGVSVGEKTLDVTKGEETLNLTIPYATKANIANQSQFAFDLYTSADPGVNYRMRYAGCGILNEKCFAGSSPDSTKWSYPTDCGTAKNATHTNIQGIRMNWDTKYFSDIFMTPNKRGLYFRQVLNGGAEDWHKFAFEDSTVAKAQTLATPRTIFGQAFDGSGNVSGNITTANHIMSGTIYQSCPSTKRNFDQGIRLAGATKDNCYSIISFGCDPEAETGTHSTQWTVGRNVGNNFVCDRSGSGGQNGFIITTAGNMGIGRADASYKLDVNGTARCSTLTQISDARLKENVADYELPLAVIANAPSVTYNWKADGKQDIGGIAQYWEQAQPLLTDRDNEGMLSMEYGKTAYLAAVTLAREVQKLKQENADLRAELAELRGLVKGLIKGSE